MLRISIILANKIFFDGAINAETPTEIYPDKAVIKYVSKKLFIASKGIKRWKIFDIIVGKISDAVNPSGIAKI